MPGEPREDTIARFAVREKARGVVVRYSIVLCGVRGYRSHRDISSGRPDTLLPSPGTVKAATATAAAAQKPRVPYSLHALSRSVRVRASCTRWNSNTVAGAEGEPKGDDGGSGAKTRTTRELPAVDGFPSRLENTIDPPVAYAHPRRFVLLLLLLLFASSSSPFFSFLSALIHRSTFLTVETKRRARTCNDENLHVDCLTSASYDRIVSFNVY